MALSKMHLGVIALLAILGFIAFALFPTIFVGVLLLLVGAGIITITNGSNKWALYVSLGLVAVGAIVLLAGALNPSVGFCVANCPMPKSGNGFSSQFRALVGV
jgi:hypothetical protein